MSPSEIDLLMCAARTNEEAVWLLWRQWFERYYADWVGEPNGAEMAHALALHELSLNPLLGDEFAEMTAEPWFQEAVNLYLADLR